MFKTWPGHCVLFLDKNFTLTVPLSTNEYEMGTSELSEKPDEMLGVTCNGLASHPVGVAVLLVTSCYGNRDKLWQCGPLGS